MALTVFAENMGFFHKGSNGKGIAPLDFCLSPPPPPAGPLPIPYVNMLQASDLAKGSKTVEIDGQPTALEDASYISTSMGDEMGTQGGSVITHKTKGKGYFTLWSSTVLVEGKGVCRHGDLMGQNCASVPPGCVNMAALVNFSAFLDIMGANKGPCPPDKPYDRKGSYNPNSKQKAQIKGSSCWECLKGKPPRKVKAVTADHQPPISVAWKMGGCHLPDGVFDEWARSRNCVIPHCRACSRAQGGTVGKLTGETIKSWKTGKGPLADAASWSPMKSKRLLEWANNRSKGLK